MAYAHNMSMNLDPVMTPEEREAAWLAEEAEVDEGDGTESKQMTDEERKKRDEERAKVEAEREKVVQQETEEITTMAKRKGYKVYVHGRNFINTGELLQIRFSYNNGEVTQNVSPVFKNTKLLGVVLPDMGADVPIGQHMLTAELTLNGQQYSSSGCQLLFNQVDPNLTEEDLRKMDEDEAKNQKKGAKRK